MDLVHGCIGGFVGTIISHPIDTVKTRVQSKLSFKDAIAAKKFFSGLKWPIILVPIEKSIVFGVSQKSKEFGINPFWSGAIAGVVSTIIVTPMEYLKINMQKGLTMNIATMSVKQMYSGLIPTICRESPGYAIYISTYDNLTYRYNPQKNPIKSFIFGGITGLVSWLVIYPTDLVKTRVQDKHNTMTVLEVTKSIYNSGNHTGFIRKGFNFYIGIHWALARAIPLHAGVFMGYEVSKSYLNINL
jgi:solute carrier family 25 carnitine/acylcarnitine transporter 20/29